MLSDPDGWGRRRAHEDKRCANCGYWERVGHGPNGVCALEAFERGWLVAQTNSDYVCDRYSEDG